MPLAMGENYGKTKITLGNLWSIKVAQHGRMIFSLRDWIQAQLLPGENYR